MIIDNTSLGFSDSQNDCDCRGDEFCQLVAKEDNPVWQITAECSELTGGTTKQPCESNQIGVYTADFYTDVPLSEEVIITDSYIKFIEAQSAANAVRTADLFLAPNTCYFLRYSVTSYLGGYIQTKNGFQRTANGTYTEIYCTDEFGFFQFTYGPDDNPEVLTSLILSNIFIGCIRYSSLYDIDITEGQEEAFKYISQTSFEKTETTANVIEVSLKDTSSLIIGLVYKICFTIFDAVSGTVDMNFGSASPVPFSSNGRHCDSYLLGGSTDFSLTLSTDFVGKVGDISIELVPEIKAELFDCEGNIVEDGLTLTPIENTVKLEISDDVPEGCYNIGIADSCANFKHQFYGNVLDVPDKFSETINTTTGAWTATPPPNEEGFWVNRILFKDAVCCGKLYTGTFIIGYSGEEELPTITYFSITIIIGGLQYNQVITPPLTLDNPYQFDFSSIEAGCENSDIEILLEYQWESSEDILFGTLNLDNGDTFLNMDADQMCPEKFSRCLKVVEAASCCPEPTVLIKYRNDNNAFGFDYVSEGYRLEDGFYNQLRIPAKVWKASYPKTTKIQKNSNGLRSKYFADVDKKFVLNTGRLPEEMHDALSIALEHNTVLIDEIEYVCSSEDYEPEWNKSSALATVEVELFAQLPRKVNTKC